MNLPQIGETMEDAGGRRWRVHGVALNHWQGDDEFPESWTFHVDVEPVREPVPIPEMIRREFES